MAGQRSKITLLQYQMLLESEQLVAMWYIYVVLRCLLALPGEDKVQYAGELIPRQT